MARSCQSIPIHGTFRSDIYVEDCWQPIFAEMRAREPVNFVPESPYGPYWNVTTSKAIQHVEALPELYSSSWDKGGITIGEQFRFQHVKLTDEDTAGAAGGNGGNRRRCGPCGRLGRVVGRLRGVGLRRSARR